MIANIPYGISYPRFPILKFNARPKTVKGQGPNTEPGRVFGSDLPTIWCVDSQKRRSHLQSWQHKQSLQYLPSFAFALAIAEALSLLPTTLAQTDDM